MNKNKILRLIVAFIMLLNISSFAFADAGITSGQILSYNPNPDTEAMGEAGIALTSNKPAAAILNPASTIATYRTVLSLSNSTLYGDIQYNYIGAQFPTIIGIFGLAFMYAGYGDIEYLNISGNKLDMNSTNDIAFVLNYSLPIKGEIPIEKLRGGVGANIKVLRTSLADYTSEAFAVDFGGILYVPRLDNLSIGMTYKNLGTGQKFVREKYSLPQVFVLGLGYHEKDFYNLKIALDFNAQAYSGNYFSVGASITPVYFLTFRGGVKLGDESINSDLRLGLGFEFQSFMFDYSYTYSDKLNTTHNFNLSYAIGNFSNQKTAYDYYMKNHFREAVELFNKNDFISSRQKFDEILSVYPEHRPSQRYLQRIIDELNEIDMYNARRVNKYMKQANKSIEKGNAVDAVKYFNKVLELDAENSLAKTGIEKVDEYTYIVSVEREREKHKEQIEYLWKRSEKFYKRGDLVRAKEALSYILDIDPENQPAKDGIVNIDNQFSKIAADKVNEMYSKGMNLFNQGKFQESVRYFEAIVVAAPHRRDAQDMITRAESAMEEIVREQRYENLRKQQEKVMAEVNRNFETALNYYQKNRLAEALRYFTRSKEIADKVELTEISKNAQNYMSRISYDLSETHYRRGFEFYRKNDFERAEREYRLAINYNPANTSAKFEHQRVADDLANKYYEEGMAHYAKSDFEKARNLLKKSLYYKPDKTEAKRALEKLQ